MFENITLFTKQDNIVNLPNEGWNIKSKIHCTCELNLGFGSGKIIWSHGNSIRLTKMIDFYNKLCLFLYNSSEDVFKYEFSHNDNIYILECIKEIDILYILKNRYYNRERILLEKKNISVSSLRNKFFIDVMKILTCYTTNEVSTKYGELFFRINGFPHNYEYKIGQKVKTLVSNNIKTERIGFIINRFYHHKEQTAMYQIMENGILINTRYKPEDLIS